MEEQNRKLLGRLTRLRAEMLKEYPFFGNLMMRLRFGVADCETAYTDMQRIVFDPAFAERLSDEEMKFVFMHEVMHCVLKHCVRGKGLISEIYNIACDIVVNSNLLYYMQQSDIQIDGEAVMHRTPQGDEGYRYSAEDVYQMLISMGNNSGAGGRDGSGSGTQGRGSSDRKGNGSGKKSGDTGKDRNRDSGKRDGSGPARIDTHEVWSRLEKNDAVVGQWEQALKEYGSHGFSLESTAPPAARALIEGWQENRKVDWKDLLYEYISMVYDSSDYSFSPPDRRFADQELILPYENPELTEHLQDIWFCVDTSGSVSTEDLSKICGEIANLYHEITKAEGMISFFDTRVTEPVTFSSREELMEMRPIGGGGTSFTRIFEYLKEQAPTEEYHGLKAKATHALLKKISKSVEKDSDILWNFTKFLISKDGETIKRYAPTTEPKDFEKDIEEFMI